MLRSSLFSPPSTQSRRHAVCHAPCDWLTLLHGMRVSVGGFTYREQSHNGRSGTACFSGLGKDSFPQEHVEFWRGLPYVLPDLR